MEDSKNKKSILGELISWAKSLAMALIIALLINNFLLVNASIESGSMETTIMTGDRVLCHRLAYLTQDPSRFDVVIFNYTQDDGEAIKYVKRIIGLPGETVDIVDGKVYIDSSPTPLPDSFTNGSPHGDFGPFEVPEDHYFVLGDNRNNSYDSKSWLDPYLPQDKILGKVFCTYYPIPGLLSKVTG